MVHGMHERNLNPAPDAVDDLVLLRDSDINERGITNDLRNRYNNDLIYTYIGPVLLSVNPFKQIRNLYAESLMQEYYGRYQFEVAPHVFSVSEDAHRKLMGTGLNQCVLISGESGAGKTEAAKQVMQYVSKVSSDDTEYSNPRYSYANKPIVTRSVKDIKDSLLKSNPVLESFGNAKTIRNDNSSRFGKYMEILMDLNGVPIGGKISNYLLEKPRVVFQSKGERNFHVFYLLTNGLNSSSSLYRSLQLREASFFDCLCDKDSVKVNTVDDQEWFQEMDSAMKIVGVEENVKVEVYKLVAAVLWLGNIKFSQTKNKGQDACKVSNKDALKVAAELLSVTPNDLETALTTRSRETVVDKVASPLTKIDECDKVRDALSKALYARGFQKIVELINKTIETKVSDLSLGVLDIYGFEIFEKNSFEQLLINFCNEKLQQYFIQLTLKAEQEEYLAEGISWKNIDYFNNKIVCDLIESKRPPGIIAFLDEEITLNRTNDSGKSDLSFLAKMNQNLSSHKHYEIPVNTTNNKSGAEEFVIKHYAGDVKYSAESMVDKNKDTLYRDLLLLLAVQSKSGFLQSLFPEGKEKHDFKKPLTAGSQFVIDMGKLIETLERCEPHYIRTIKPNDNKRAGLFDEERVVQQVRYLGLVENVKVRRAGFAFRQQYDRFVRRYKMLDENIWRTPLNRLDFKRATTDILTSVEITKKEYEFGKTKIFIENPKSLFKLETKREQAIHWVAGIIQHAYRQWRLRLYFQKIRELAVSLLHRKKRRNNSWVLYYLGDYIEANKNDKILQIVRENNDSKIVFADFVENYMLQNNKQKQSIKAPLKKRLIFVLTRKSVLLFDLKFDLLKRIVFEDIENFSFSTFADDFLVINLKSKFDSKSNKQVSFASFVIESVRKSEIATVLNEEYKNSVSQNAPLVFSDEITCFVLAKQSILNKLISKPKAVQHFIMFSENSDLSGRQTEILKPVKKNEENYEKLKNVTEINVSPKLGSKAELQLSEEIPERVLAHTAVGRQGKKKMRNRRRKY